MSTLILASLGAFLASSLGALLPGERKNPSSLPVWGCAAAAVLGLIPTVSVLAGAPPVDLALPWGLPGTFHLRLDLLSGWFAVPVLGISFLAAIYGRTICGTPPSSPGTSTGPSSPSWRGGCSSSSWPGTGWSSW